MCSHIIPYCEHGNYQDYFLFENISEGAQTYNYGSSPVSGNKAKYMVRDNRESPSKDSFYYKMYR